MDQIAAMRAFARVVEAGTFSRAADLLDMPKPTVTKLIQQLEAHLRTKLLNRSTRRVAVTPDGAAYYERALALLSDLDELDGSMARSQASPSGRLRVDVPSSLALYALIPALPDFFARYPEIRLDLGVTDRPVDLLAENVDCAIRGGDLIDPTLIARRIGEVRLMLCAAPGYLQRHGVPGHPRDLQQGHRVIGYFSARTGRRVAFDMERGEESYELDLPYDVAVNDSTAYLAAGLAGLGVTQSLEPIVRPLLAAGLLVRVLPEWNSAPIVLHIVYAPNRHLSSRLRVFVDWIAELFGSGGAYRHAAPSLLLPARPAG
ncbi:LysR family transcriptional regulator [Ancylobacter dichloromethanicus]|uniref:LysR family transcriptional regulator n=1 Tax=Ancylobacter dichloromethanicus TaxID=518825 RepID=A0A9W6JCQ5_9HYPH|nr:LysR family transcriptional regulator [Ancylobacter dichloromethanicus]MBS7552265.1 LysR family transcriptional regulator [Ancylobacter dichloromethanicus]GLK74001.1 LysR family transcriptional regulator [Ancylobacter dichloromethanicus]